MPESLTAQLIPVVIGGILGLAGTVIGSYLKARLTKNRELVNSVYRPLFNEVHDVVEHGELPYNSSSGEFESIWRKFDGFQRFRVDEEIAGQMSMIEADLEELNTFLDLLEYSLMEVVQGTELDSNGGEPKIIGRTRPNGEPASFIEVRDWLDRYGVAFVKADSKENLRNELIMYSKENNVGNPQLFEDWHDKQFVRLWNAVQKAESEWEIASESSYERYVRILDMAQRVRDEIGREALNVL